MRGNPKSINKVKQKQIFFHKTDPITYYELLVHTFTPTPNLTETENKLFTICASSVPWLNKELNIELVIQLIKDPKLNINVKDNDNLTPLYYACYNGNLEICKLLIIHGADLNIADKIGMTLLLIAVKFRYFEIVKLLIKHNIDLNITDNNGWTALHHASINGDLEMIKILVYNGADITITTKVDKNIISRKRNCHVATVTNKEGATAAELAKSNEIKTYILTTDNKFNIRSITHSKRLVDYCVIHTFYFTVEYLVYLLRK